MIRPRHRHMLLRRGRGQVLIIVGPRLVVVVDAWKVRVGENGGQIFQPTAGLEFQSPAFVERPSALPFVLVFVGPRVSLPRPGLHIVEPDMFGSGLVRPYLFAGDRTRVAAD